MIKLLQTTKLEIGLPIDEAADRCVELTISLEKAIELLILDGDPAGALRMLQLLKAFRPSAKQLQLGTSSPE